MTKAKTPYQILEVDLHLHANNLGTRLVKHAGKKAIREVIEMLPQEVVSYVSPLKNGGFKVLPHQYLLPGNTAVDNVRHIVHSSVFNYITSTLPGKGIKLVIDSLGEEGQIIRNNGTVINQSLWAPILDWTSSLSYFDALPAKLVVSAYNTNFLVGHNFPEQTAYCMGALGLYSVFRHSVASLSDADQKFHEALQQYSLEENRDNTVALYQALFHYITETINLPLSVYAMFKLQTAAFPGSDNAYADAARTSLRWKADAMVLYAVRSFTAITVELSLNSILDGWFKISDWWSASDVDVQDSVKIEIISDPVSTDSSEKSVIVSESPVEIKIPELGLPNSSASFGYHYSDYKASYPVPSEIFYNLNMNGVYSAMAPVLPFALVVYNQHSKPHMSDVQPKTQFEIANEMWANVWVDIAHEILSDVREIVAAQRAELVGETFPIIDILY